MVLPVIYGCRKCHYTTAASTLPTFHAVCPCCGGPWGFVADRPKPAGGLPAAAKAKPGKKARKV